MKNIKTEYKIKEVADICGESQQTIRNWQKQIRDLKPKVSDSGHRIYSPRDLHMLRVISYFIRKQKMKVDGVNQYIKQVGLKTFLEHDIGGGFKPIFKGKNFEGLFDDKSQDPELVARKYRSAHYNQLSGILAELNEIKSDLDNKDKSL